MPRERVLVVGAGGIAGVWFEALRAARVRVAGVVDLARDRAEARIREFALDCPAYTDLGCALAGAPSDFVLDLTVPEAHAAVTCRALAAGRHVLGEKPMADSLAAARRMVRAAERADRLYMVSQSRRWDARHATVRRALASGRFGALTTVNCDFYIGAHFGGFRDAMDSPLILDMAIHHFDLVRFMTGKDPVAVYAHAFNPAGSWYRGAPAATCIFELTDGVVFTYRGSWCAEGCHTSWNGDWRFVGTRGTLRYERDGAPAGQVVAGDSGFHRPLADVTPPPVRVRHTQMRGGLDAMLCYLRRGAVPATECHDNIRSLAMVFAALESARSGRRVKVAC